MHILSLFFIVILICNLSLGKSTSAKSFKSDIAWLKLELKKRNFTKPFINDAIKNYDQKSFETVLKLNLLGFLKPPQHMDHVTAQAIEKTSIYLQKNNRTLIQAQNKYQVPAEVVASLLWIETRHGEDLGNFHITSVYLHLLQSHLKKNRNLLKKMALEENKNINKFKNNELSKLMHERTKARHKWAFEQLQALQSIYNKNQINLKTLTGSFAGAFGLAQFIPSSYRDFAKASQNNEKKRLAPDLFKTEDAITSVAHYLAKHGWDKNKPESEIEALMKYNNSRDYAESILVISKKSKSLNPKIKNFNATTEIEN